MGSRYYNWNSGKALGGAMGGYTTAKKEVIELLRQRSRPIYFQIL
jgi:7-keto-8-aminopelargonate synthetase-like enzyme